MTVHNLSNDVAASSGRNCAGCTACCVLPEIEALQKPADIPCRHCSVDKGCRAYDARPQLCRDFLCLWVTDDALGPQWQPSRTGMLVYRQGAQLTVLVDPARRGIWWSEPYATDLVQMAQTIEEEGGYLILFCGETVERIRPVIMATPQI